MKPIAKGEGLGELGRGAWRRLRQGMAADAMRVGGPRQAELNAPAIRAFIESMEALAPGDPAAGRRMVFGHITRGGEQLACPRHPTTLWEHPARSGRLAAWLHSFDWLRDLAACGDEAAVDLARLLAEGWIGRYADGSEPAWASETTALRTLAWLTQADILFGGDGRDAQLRRSGLARHVRQLERSMRLIKPGRGALLTAFAACVAGVCVDGQGKLLTVGLEQLGPLLEAQILVDGGHIGRAPEAVLETLTLALALDAALAAAGVDGPAELRRAIDRMTPMLRFFTMNDGALAAFHGGGEGDRRTIAAILSHDDAGGRAFGFAPHAGYHRIDAGGTILIFDVGGPAPVDYAHEVHASPLAFELSTPSGRLIVNCGWSDAQPEAFRDPIRSTAAHSTLTAADTSSVKVGPKGLRRDLLHPRGLAGPKVTSRRSEEDRGIWIEASHDGYHDAFGLVHRRVLFVDQRGGDVRGEDTLFRPVNDPAPRTSATTPFAIRFHLHPDVRATLAKDARSVMLTLANGDGWRLRTDAGPLGIEQSVYLAHGDTPAKTRQIVINGVASPNGAVDGPPNRVRWAMQRIGRTAGG